jgi:ADP-heptose:LPS heptosyltransferase
LPKRILVVQVGKIGDMILTTPLFPEIKKLFPDCELFVLTSPVNNEIALRDKNVSGTIIYKKSALSVSKLLFTLRRLRFDYWIDTKDEYSSTSKTLLKLGNYDKSLGFNTKENIYDISLKEFVKGEHTVDINLSPIFYFKKDYKFKDIKPSIKILSGTSDKFHNIFKKIKSKKILINISAGAENRYWKEEKWLELLSKIDNSFNLLLISDKKDRRLADKIIRNYKGKNLLHLIADSIFEVAEIVRNSDIIVTPDTSIVHLASCFNKPIVAMFHNVEWVIKRYAPLSNINRIILSKERNTISDIKVDTVLESLKDIYKLI